MTFYAILRFYAINTDHFNGGMEYYYISIPSVTSSYLFASINNTITNTLNLTAFEFVYP